MHPHTLMRHKALIPKLRPGEIVLLRGVAWIIPCDIERTENGITGIHLHRKDDRGAALKLLRPTPSEPMLIIAQGHGPDWFKGQGANHFHANTDWPPEGLYFICGIVLEGTFVSFFHSGTWERQSFQRTTK